MDESEDILGILGSSEETFKEEPTAVKKTYGDEDEINYWEETDIPLFKVDTSKFNSSGKSFTMCVYNNREDLSVADEDKLFKIASFLISKGFLFRHTGGHKDSLQTKIMEIEGAVVQSYLPWKKFNLLIEKPKLYKPKGPAFGIAASSHKAYKKLPPSVRYILARNVHAMIGPKVDDPVTLALVYSKDGAEALKRDMDFKLTGDVAFYLKVCGDANIPVFNTKSEDVAKRLAEFLKTKD